jgi:hypothetical protein
VENYRTQYDRPAACVIAQQYYSAAFASLRFHSRKEKLGARFKDAISFTSKKLSKSEIA